MKRLVLFIIATIILTTFSYAAPIGYFPGFDELIEKSDAIVILRVDKNISNGYPDGNLYTTHECYIYKTLKGDIEEGKTIPLQLMDTMTSMVSPFSIGSTHLMFLMKKQDEWEETDYRTITFEGANIELSPFGNEKIDTNKDIKENILYLISEYRKYRAEMLKKEDELLSKFK